MATNTLIGANYNINNFFDYYRYAYNSISPFFRPKLSIEFDQKRIKMYLLHHKPMADLLKGT